MAAAAWGADDFEAGLRDVLKQMGDAVGDAVDEVRRGFESATGGGWPGGRGEHKTGGHGEHEPGPHGEHRQHGSGGHGESRERGSDGGRDRGPRGASRERPGWGWAGGFGGARGERPGWGWAEGPGGPRGERFGGPRGWGYGGPRGRGQWGGGFGGPWGNWWPGAPPGPAGPGWGPKGPKGPKAGRGDVRAAILALLKEGPRNGYQIMSEIAERSGGAWRPSPGAVYPALSQLADEGLIVGEEEDGRRTFSLTDAGREYVAEHPERARGAWESAEQQQAWEVPGLFAEAARLGGGIVQLAHAGTHEQIAAAERLLAQTRRDLYRILADDDGEPATGEPQTDAPKSTEPGTGASQTTAETQTREPETDASQADASQTDVPQAGETETGEQEN